MGLYEAGGTVEFDGKPLPLNTPRACLDASLAFVSEDRRGVGLLLDNALIHLADELLSRARVVRYDG